MSAKRPIDCLVYDLEIVHAVPQSGVAWPPGTTFCKGWDDKGGMGVSVLVALDMASGRTHVYFEDGLADFEQLARDRCLVGFNSKHFDDLVLRAQGINVTTTYDLKDELLEGCKAAKAERSAPGRRLDDWARVNLGVAKRDANHALTPVYWQQGKRSLVVNDCIEDVLLTAKLVRRIPTLLDPVSLREITVRPIPAIEPALF